MVVASQQQIYPQIIQRSYYTPVVRQDHVRVTMNFNIIAALSCVKFPTNMYETTLLYLRRHKATVFVILNVLFAVISVVACSNIVAMVAFSMFDYYFSSLLFLCVALAIFISSG